MSFDLLNRGEPDRVDTGVVSANFFDVLGVRPKLGRTFVDGDDDAGAPAVLVLSHEYWRTRFGGDPDIVGQTFQMNDRPHTVVGVLPPIPQYPADCDVYMPTSACPFRAAAERRIAEQRRIFARAAGLRTVEARRPAGGGRRVGGHGGGPLPPRSPRRVPRRPGVSGHGRRPARRVDPQRASDAARADRRHAARAAHRLRQRRQPLDGARAGARPRAGAAHRPWRQPLADRRPAARRKRAALAGRRRRGPGRCVEHHRRADDVRRAVHLAHPRCVARPGRAGLRARPLAADGRDLRRVPRPDVAPLAGRRAQAGRSRRPGSSTPPPAAGPRGRAGGRVGRAAGGRRAAALQPPSSAERPDGLSGRARAVGRGVRQFLALPDRRRLPAALRAAHRTAVRHGLA